jgi:hypothetical protein
MYDSGRFFKYCPGSVTPAKDDEASYRVQSIRDAWRRCAGVSLRVVYETARRIQGVRLAAVGCKRGREWRIETRVRDAFRVAVESMLLPSWSAGDDVQSKSKLWP